MSAFSRNVCFGTARPNPSLWLSRTRQLCTQREDERAELPAGSAQNYIGPDSMLEACIDDAILSLLRIRTAQHHALAASASATATSLTLSLPLPVARTGVYS